MKQVLYVLTIGLPVLFSAWAEAAEIDVYLLGGQSNAAGRALQSNVSSDPSGIGSTFADLTNSNIMLWYSDRLNGAIPDAPNTWTTLRPAAQFAGAGNFGPEIGLGNRLLELNPTRNIAIIKHARGATSLHTNWDVDAAGSNEWTEFSSTVHAALQAIIDQGDTPIIRGMAWQQGENDANSSLTQAQAYGQNLQDLILEARSEFSAPEMTFVYGTVLQNISSFPHEALIRAGQDAVDQDSGDALATHRAFLIDADDLTTNFNSDAIHLDYVGQLTLGERFAEQFGVIPQPGDLDGDGFVGAIDLDILLQNWGSASGSLSTGDANGDGTVGQGDLDIVLAGWGEGSLSGSQVPEPTALSIWLVGYLLLNRRQIIASR